MAPKFYIDDDLVFTLQEEPEFFRLRVNIPEIEEEHVEEFMDTTVEWLSTNPQKGILIDFKGVRYVCGDFAVTLNKYYEDIKSRGLYVRFVNVDPGIEPFIDVSNITVVMSLPPQKPRVTASGILDDLAQNLSDEELMRKHGLSEKGLARMYGKLLRKGVTGRGPVAKKVDAAPGEAEIAFDADDSHHNKPVVDVTEVLKDLAFGVTNTDLMHKYKLTQRGLESLARKLFHKGLITKSTMIRLAGNESNHLGH
jgi:anti-anti-sigma regulatory factor